jgi:putative FmdB family regulatory protein
MPDRGVTTSRCTDIGEEEEPRNGVRPAPTQRAPGKAGDLFVIRRRRCYGIDSSSFRDLASPSPSQTSSYLWSGVLTLGFGMPIFEYRCAACEHEFELIVLGSKSESEIACPRCERSQVEKLFSSFSARSRARDGQTHSLTSRCGSCRATSCAGCK